MQDEDFSAQIKWLNELLGDAAPVAPPQNNFSADEKEEVAALVRRLTPVFNETASDAREAFPARLQRLAVFMTPGMEREVYAAPLIAEKFDKHPGAVKNAINRFARWMKELNAAGIASRFLSVADELINLIALDVGDLHGPFGPRYTKEMIAVFALDHELGHHIVRNGSDADEHVAECAADAFAALRHIQRYGRDTDINRVRAHTMAGAIVLKGDTEHYTSAAFEQAMQLADKMGDELFTLSLEEIAQHAGDIAQKAALEQTVLNKIHNAYATVASYCAKHIGTGTDISRRMFEADPSANIIYCQQTLAVMRDKRCRKDADIFKAGKQLLETPHIKALMTQLAAAEIGNYWKDALGFLERGAATAYTPHLSLRERKGPMRSMGR